VSTRANILVQSQDEKILLYRHCDGYPGSVIPSLQAAFRLSMGNWEAGRPYKAASYIIAEGVRPEGGAPYTAYEPLPYLELHGDIEYYYQVTCLPGTGNAPSLQNLSKWLIEVFAVGHRGKHTLLGTGEAGDADLLARVLAAEEQDKED